jgi:hypothetical protein
LHCNDSLEYAALFDEGNVMQFDVNDNGESFCGLDNIKAFYFNKDLLIGSRIKTNKERPTLVYFAYSFVSKEAHEFKTETELRKFAKSKGFNGNEELYSCKSYYGSF